MFSAHGRPCPGAGRERSERPERASRALRRAKVASEDPRPAGMPRGAGSCVGVHGDDPGPGIAAVSYAGVERHASVAPPPVWGLSTEKRPPMGGWSAPIGGSAWSGLVRWFGRPIAAGVMSRHTADSVRGFWPPSRTGPGVSRCKTTPGRSLPGSVMGRNTSVVWMTDAETERSPVRGRSAGERDADEVAAAGLAPATSG